MTDAATAFAVLALSENDKKLGSTSTPENPSRQNRTGTPSATMNQAAADTY
jgi:hypothetical protein